MSVVRINAITVPPERADMLVERFANRAGEVSKSPGFEAFEAAAVPDRYASAGEPWQPLKLYYQMTFHKERVVALHEATLEAGLESPFTEWLDRWEDKPEDLDRVTTRIECADWFDIRDRALIAHATQIDPNGRWFSLPTELQRRAWSTEDFQLARSLVDTSLPEDDLFAGIRTRVEA